MADYVGPCTINCPQKCAVPEGAEMSVVARSRHVWSDVIVCPHEGCGIALLVTKKDTTDICTDNSAAIAQSCAIGAVTDEHAVPRPINDEPCAMCGGKRWVWRQIPGGKDRVTVPCAACAS